MPLPDAEEVGPDAGTSVGRLATSVTHVPRWTAGLADSTVRASRRSRTAVQPRVDGVAPPGRSSTCAPPRRSWETDPRWGQDKLVCLSLLVCLQFPPQIVAQSGPNGGILEHRIQRRPHEALRRGHPMDRGFEPAADKPDRAFDLRREHHGVSRRTRSRHQTAAVSGRRSRSPATTPVSLAQQSFQVGDR